MKDVDVPEFVKTKEDRVRFLLRRLALSASAEGTLAELAKQTHIHPMTISDYMTKGLVPEIRARYLEQKFGAHLAPAHELCWKIEAPKDSSN